MGVVLNIPYRDLGFMGTPNKEMVFAQPALNCLVNLTKTLFFCIDLSEVNNAHFERVLINKVATKQPEQVDMIPANAKDSIQEWLVDIEISCAEGPMNLIGNN